MTASELYFHIKKVFEQGKIESSSFEAMCVIEEIFGRKLPQLLLEKSEASEQQLNRANEIAVRRINGYPLQYILGKWEFFGLPFYVGEGVLIPRQDTETLVDWILEENRCNTKIIDLCSGSGCIAISLCANIKGADVTAVEISEKAVEYIKKNIEENNVNVKIENGDVLKKSTSEKFNDVDILVCNPPYLTSDDMKKLQKEVSFEPSMALFGGEDGLDFYRTITAIWKDSLRTGGKLVFEIGMGQEKDVAKILEDNGFINIETRKDLAGIVRAVRGEK